MKGLSAKFIHSKERINRKFESLKCYTAQLEPLAYLRLGMCPRNFWTWMAGMLFQDPYRFAVEEGDDILDGIPVHPGKVFRGDVSDVGGQQDVVELANGMARRQGLYAVQVDGGAGALLLRQGL